MAKKIINLYGVGGTGVNIVKNFLDLSGRSENGFAEINTFFIDTSKSNVDDSIPLNNVYFFEGRDGVGKKKDIAIHDEAVIAVEEIALQFKPDYLNVVIHSASGGTGSMAGPFLTKKLMEMGGMTIVILIGSHDSRIECKNTITTIQTYESFSAGMNKPIHMFYFENTTESPRGVNDSEIKSIISLLSIFFSGENEQLDTKDFQHFFDYPSVTERPRSITQLVFTQQVKLKKGHITASAVTLTEKEIPSLLNTPIDYQTVGIVNPAIKEKLPITIPMHMICLLNTYPDILESLNARLAIFDEGRDIRPTKNILTGSETKTGHGVIF